MLTRRGGPVVGLRRLQNSGIEKAFLFDVVSKIYIATDSSPVDMQTYELCSDMIDVVIDVSSIYGYAVRSVRPVRPMPAHADTCERPAITLT